jgi:hypothetical protein
MPDEMKVDETLGILLVRKTDEANRRLETRAQTMNVVSRKFCNG